ncbi:RCC1 domain-containing protein [Legionella cardiaca]|uniref:RCC1-like domain-containing protein n=1 Tax=Legionella cardiaca TaxID=1071983 RepID=A0ABY8ATE9_9GAMM|nr:hypothetical protein [Legionella cardiaca]WED43955.1 hypothetical protein PXX05_03995 [Legionella cardiaca]
MPSSSQEITLTILPVDIICYLALNYLDYQSAVNLFKEIIIKHFSLQHALTSNEDLFDELKKFRSSHPYNQCENVRKQLFPKIAAGDYVSFYFLPSEGWFVWGSKDAEQLTGIRSNRPQKLKLPFESLSSQFWQKPQLNIVDIACYSSRTFFLTSEGKIYQTGKDFRDRNISPPLKFVKELDSKKIVKLALGNNHILALTDNGQVYSWGNNDCGQLGLEQHDDCNIPQLITAFKKIRITAIFAGRSTSFCLSEEGEVYAFGDNEASQLGLENVKMCIKPQLIPAFKDKKIISIACGYSHTLFLSYENEVFSTGLNISGALGIIGLRSTKKPTLIDSLRHKKITMITTCLTHTVCVDEQGKVYSFGRDYSQESLISAGFGIPKLVPIPEGEVITAVTAGIYHVLCLSKKGELYSFGSNTHTQLGHEEKKPHKVTFSTNLVTNDSALQESLILNKK